MVLVTGANGRVGHSLVNDLLKKGEKVRAFVRKETKLKCIEKNEENLEFTIGDVLDYESLNKAMKGVDMVYHLAAIIQIFPGTDEITRKVNFEGTKNVIHACESNKVKKLLYVSSIHALKEPPHGTTITEEMPFDPENNRGEYDRSKALASLAVLEAGKKGLHVNIVCPTGIMGPCDIKPSLFGQSIINFVKGKQPMYIDGAYDYVDVRDVVGGMIKALEKAKSGEVFILSSEKMSMSNFNAYIQEFMDKKVKLIKLPFDLIYFIAQIMEYFIKIPALSVYGLKTLRSNSDISHEKATRELGYKPRGVKESLRDQYEWFKEEGLV